jgi:hypothetical protein
LGDGTTEDSAVPVEAVLIDRDADGCSDANELGPDEALGGLRDPKSPWDYFNPSHDGENRVDDVLTVIGQYYQDAFLDPPINSDPNPAYRLDTDRSSLGPNPWNLGPPNGQQRIDDILAIIYQYHHDCS